MRVLAVCSVVVLIAGVATVVGDEFTSGGFSFEKHKDSESSTSTKNVSPNGSRFPSLDDADSSFSQLGQQKTRDQSRSSRTSSDLSGVRNYQKSLFGSSPLLTEDVRSGKPSKSSFLNGSNKSSRSSGFRTSAKSRQSVKHAEFNQPFNKKNSIRQVQGFSDDFFPFENQESSDDGLNEELNNLDMELGDEFGLESRKANSDNNAANNGPQLNAPDQNDFDLLDGGTPNDTGFDFESDFSLDSEPANDESIETVNKETRKDETLLSEPDPSNDSETVENDFPEEELLTTSPSLTPQDTLETRLSSSLSSGTPSAPTVKVYWEKQGSINVGQQFDCQLIVENTSQSTANQVSVEAFFPKSARLVDASPRPVDKTDRLLWSFDELTAGQKKVITITVIPNRAGALETQAQVRFTGAASGVFTVEQPMLTAAITGPDQVVLGESAAHVITLSNPGSGIARNVVLEARLSAGLEHPRGEKLVMPIGSLSPTEKRVIRLPLSAISGGVQSIKLVVKADSISPQAAGRKIEVVAPSIQVAVDGPGLRYIGRKARYVLTAANNGEAASSNVRLLHKLPEGFEFINADKDGKYDRSRHTVSWFVGRIDAGRSTKRHVELKATGAGEFTHRVGAISEHGTQVEAAIDTQVEGTASLVLEIVDLDDPVEIGVETAYEVRVRNDGTAVARNVEISCELPADVRLIGAKGPTSFRAQRKGVGFASLGQLPPNKTAIYQIRVRGGAAGNHRFRVRMSSDSIQKPLIFEELTKFYKDE